MEPTESGTESQEKKAVSSRKLLDRREKALAEIETLAKRAETEQRELTSEEIAQRDKLAAKAAKLEQRAFEARVAEADEKRAAAAAARNDLGIGNAPANSPGGAVTVRSSERTYHKGGQISYLYDLAARCLGNTGAGERLARHASEVAVDAAAAEARMKAGSPQPWDGYFVRQVRAAMAAGGAGEIHARTGDLSTSAGSGGEFVPPAYLTAEYVPYARAGRVFADSCNKQDLPPGTMSINIPKINAGTTVAAQATQNTAVSDTALETEYVTFPVITVAGQQTLSLQLLERSPIAFDDVTFKDLTLALATQVDSQSLNGTGSSGQVTGALNTSSIIDVTWNTGGSGGIKGLFGVIANAKGQVASTRFLPATHVFFTPERWAWVEQQVDSNNRPLVLPTENGPFNVAQLAPPSALAEGATGGKLLGLVVNQDYNVPANLGTSTNQDAIIITKADDLYLYESPVVARALPQTYGNQLTVLLQVYEYMAFTAARYPASVAYITGTELTNPITYNT